MVITSQKKDTAKQTTTNKKTAYRKRGTGSVEGNHSKPSHLKKDNPGP